MTKKNISPELQKKRENALVGAHMSIAGGTHLALELGESIGCQVVQLFLKNNNRWVGKTISPEEASAFRNKMKTGSIRSVFAHDCYLINLASPREDLYQKSIDAMVDEIERADLLGVPFIVAHPGSHVGEGVDWGLQRIIEATNRVFEKTPGSNVKIAFEATAGQGTNLGHRFEHLATLIEGIQDSSRVVTCVDSCHIFAAGYDLRTPKAYAETWRAFDETIGMDRLVALHLNDSKKDLGSRVDRHEHIGKGFLGLEPFRLLMNDERLVDIPKSLETHKGKDLKEDVENLAVLRGLIE